MTDSQRHPSHPSHPPSEPRPARRSFVEPDKDSPVRLQLLGALLLPFLLIAGLLYLWRRPRSDESLTPDAAVLAASASLAVVDAAPSAPPAPEVKLGEVKVLSCQDGRKKLPPEQCDHLPTVEQALTKAIETSVKCLPESAGGGTIEYAVDVSFMRKRTPVVLSLPRAGRSFKSVRLVSPCAKAVRTQLATLSLEGTPHTHSRYKFSVVATYAGTSREP